jgi:hypothetical protein
LDSYFNIIFYGFDNIIKFWKSFSIGISSIRDYINCILDSFRDFSLWCFFNCSYNSFCCGGNFFSE